MNKTLTHVGSYRFYLRNWQCRRQQSFQIVFVYTFLRLTACQT